MAEIHTGDEVALEEGGGRSGDLKGGQARLRRGVGVSVNRIWCWLGWGRVKRGRSQEDPQNPLR